MSLAALCSVMETVWRTESMMMPMYSQQVVGLMFLLGLNVMPRSVSSLRTDSNCSCECSWLRWAA